MDISGGELTEDRRRGLGRIREELRLQPRNLIGGKATYARQEVCGKLRILGRAGGKPLVGGVSNALGSANVTQTIWA